MKRGPWLTFVIGALVVVLAPTAVAADGQADASPGEERSLILNAFGDAAGTYGESLPFIKAIESKVDRSAESAYCRAVVEGELFDQPVAIVVTGRMPST